MGWRFSQKGVDKNASIVLVRKPLENPFGRLENFGVYSTYFVYENQEN